MTFQPQLVALDIDGTLVDPDGQLPEEVKQAVQRIVAADVPVVLATGRGWDTTEPIFEQLELPQSWAVTANGAMVMTYPPLVIKQEFTFNPAPVLARAQELAPNALLAVQEGLHWRVSGEFPNNELPDPIAVQSLSELGSRPVSRVVLRDPDADDAAFLQLVEEMGLNEVSYAIGWSAWLDIMPEGISKASGLELVVHELGIDRANVLAIGDGRNDIEMLQWAGRGVAMGDAPDQVKAAADDVADLFAAGGTAKELRRWF